MAMYQTLYRRTAFALVSATSQELPSAASQNYLWLQRHYIPDPVIVFGYSIAVNAKFSRNAGNAASMKMALYAADPSTKLPTLLVANSSKEWSESELIPSDPSSDDINESGRQTKLALPVSIIVPGTYWVGIKMKELRGAGGVSAGSVYVERIFDASLLQSTAGGTKRFSDLVTNATVTFADAFPNDTSGLTLVEAPGTVAQMQIGMLCTRSS